MKRTILLGLIAPCAVCMSAVVGYSQSPQTGITSGRAQSLVAAGVALIGLVIGGVAFARSGRAGAILALVLGLIATVMSVVHLAGSTGFGTGGGRAGAIVALVLALIGMSLGGLALSRSRRGVTAGNVAR